MTPTKVSPLTRFSGLASSFLGPEVLAAQSILRAFPIVIPLRKVILRVTIDIAVTSASLFYQIPYSLSVAGAVRVGSKFIPLISSPARAKSIIYSQDLLGCQRPKQARTTSRVAMGIAVVVASVNSLLLVLFRNSWGRLFSSEDEVIGIVASILPLVALFQLTDGLSGATGGLLRGAGRAPLGALINLSQCCFHLPSRFTMTTRTLTPPFTLLGNSFLLSHWTPDWFLSRFYWAKVGSCWIMVRSDHSSFVDCCHNSLRRSETRL